jgi:hypothetical protein
MALVCEFQPMPGGCWGLASVAGSLRVLAEDVKRDISHLPPGRGLVVVSTDAAKQHRGIKLDLWEVAVPT